MVQKLRVILQPVRFRKRSHVAVIYPDNSEIDAIVRDIDESHWSTGYKYWHFPAKKALISSLKEQLSTITFVEDSAIKEIEPYNEISKHINGRKRIKKQTLTEYQAKSIEQYISSCEIKYYSPNTIKVYRSMISQFYRWCNEHRHNVLSKGTMDLYYNNYIYPNNYSDNYLKLLHNTLNKYFNYLQQKYQS